MTDTTQAVGVTKDQIRSIFMAHGFTIKDGQTDLKDYVYKAADALIRAALAAQAVPDMRDAYVGAREDLQIWKRRALVAERQLREAQGMAVGWTDADSDAARLALELECLLLDKDIPLPATSRWWASANEALDLHRKRLAASPAPAEAKEEPLTLAQMYESGRDLAVEAIWEAEQRHRAPQPQAAQPVAACDDIETIATNRYRVVPSDSSMFWRFAVVAGDGSQQLYCGREVECQVMAQKLAGAFLDGAFVQRERYTAAPALTEEQIARLTEYSMQVAHERELRMLGHKHDEEGAKRRFDAALRSTQGGDHG